MGIHACEDGKPNWLTSRVQEFKTIPFAAKFKKETVNAAGCSSGWAPTRLSPSISPLKSSCPFFFHFLRPPSMFLIRFFGSPCKKKKKCLDHFCVFICMRVVVPSSCWNRQENAKERETRQKDYPPLAVSHNRSWRKSLPVRRKNRRTFFFISVKQKIFSENFTKKQKIPPTSKKGAPFFFPQNSKKYGSSWYCQTADSIRPAIADDANGVLVSSRSES